ncbi:MAG TPA: DUF2249 domain-containing protein [Terriglobales bacterium]|nr:DUF2249 domain-containing protein [Terriglobales bacterium]
MEKHNLNDLVEFNPNRFNPKVVINEPGYRMVLISILAGQSISEHTTPGTVTIYVTRGRIRFFEGEASCDVNAGEVVTIARGAKHSVQALEDSVIFVLATGGKESDKAPLDESEELDLRNVPRPQRHPMIFAKFDALLPGASLRLLNDHDPIPLSHQFNTLRPGEALWEYMERSAGNFRIRITRIAPANKPDALLSISAEARTASNAHPNRSKARK